MADLRSGRPQPDVEHVDAVARTDTRRDRAQGREGAQQVEPDRMTHGGVPASLRSSFMQRLWNIRSPWAAVNEPAG